MWHGLLSYWSPSCCMCTWLLVAVGPAEVKCAQADTGLAQFRPPTTYPAPPSVGHLQIQAVVLLCRLAPPCTLCLKMAAFGRTAILLMAASCLATWAAPGAITQDVSATKASAACKYMVARRLPAMQTWLCLHSFVVSLQASDGMLPCFAICWPCSR